MNLFILLDLISISLRKTNCFTFFIFISFGIDLISLLIYNYNRCFVQKKKLETIKKIVIIQKISLSCQNIFFNQNIGKNILDNQQNVQKHNNTTTLQKKTIQNFEKEVNSLREATRKTKLQTKKKRF